MKPSREAIERAPVAYSAAANAEQCGNRSVASQLVDKLARGHENDDISRSVKFVKTDERQFFQTVLAGMLPCMARSTRPERSPIAIAHRIIRAREALGLTPKAVCDRTGIEPTAYSNYEGGKRPGLDAAIALCDAFGVTLDWIYLGDVSGIPHELALKLAAPEPPRPPRRRGRPRTIQP